MKNRPLSIMKNISISAQNIDRVNKYCLHKRKCSDCVLQKYANNNDMYVRPCDYIMEKYEEELMKIQKMKEILS